MASVSSNLYNLSCESPLSEAQEKIEVEEFFIPVSSAAQVQAPDILLVGFSEHDADDPRVRRSLLSTRIISDFGTLSELVWVVSMVSIDLRLLSGIYHVGTRL